MKYSEYLGTPHWQEKRIEALKVHGYHCALCGVEYQLQIHHKHYGTLGNEDAEKDLLVLCSDCHEFWHWFVKNVQEPEPERKFTYSEFLWICLTEPWRKHEHV